MPIFKYISKQKYLYIIATLTGLSGLYHKQIRRRIQYYSRSYTINNFPTYQLSALLLLTIRSLFLKQYFIIPPYIFIVVFLANSNF